MFRFYRITRFTEGKTHVDCNGLATWEDVKAELAIGGPLEGEVPPGVSGAFWYQDFLIYEG
jgi:hypothetical protein